MRTKLRIAALSAALASTSATADLPIPPDCQSDLRAIAVIDCMQTHIDILRLAKEYQELVERIEQSKASQIATPAPTNQSFPTPASARVKWFDENLEVYAITGQEEELIAHARLAGREYRLQPGDAVRLARVVNVHPRGIELAIAGTEISIGLSGRHQDPQSKN